MQRKVRYAGSTLLSMFLMCAVTKAQISSDQEGSHGTCALVVANLDNIVLVVDSRLTFSNSTNSCVEKHPIACKASLVRKDILLAVTGVFNDPVNGVDWRVKDETVSLLKKLPPSIAATDIDSFTVNWFDNVVKHYEPRGQVLDAPKVNLRRGEVSSLLIATRIDGIPHVWKVTIFWDGQLFSYKTTYLAVTKFPQNYYAGSCHDNVSSRPLGIYVPAPDPPNAFYHFEMQILGDKERAAQSVDDFVAVAKELEIVLAKVGETKDKCYIGPPYDIATWAKGDTGWSTNFKAMCQTDTQGAMRGR